MMIAKKQSEVQFSPNTFLAQVTGGRTVSNYRTDQAIYLQEAHADAVFFIQHGKVKITVTSEQGKEAIVAVLGDGQFIGEECLSGHDVRLSTAAALTQCSITRITKAEIVSVIHKEPAFAEFFISHLLARNNRTRADLVDQLFNSSEKRLARALLLLANFGGEGEPEPVLAKISQETLAEMIGTTRARVNHFMNKFRRLGFISYNGHIEVKRALLDMVLHEKPEIDVEAQKLL
jgi:CRP/FNR family transcriptional regulator, cyclic AMP receptor protein